MAATKKSQLNQLIAEGVPEDEARKMVYGDEDRETADAAEAQPPAPEGEEDPPAADEPAAAEESLGNVPQAPPPGQRAFVPHEESNPDLTNEEPPSPLTFAPGARTGAFPGDPEPFRPARVVMPLPPPEQPTGDARRAVTDEDMASPGFKVANIGAKENFDLVVLRPGDQVVGAVLVYGLNNLDEAIELLPGAIVPAGDSGYIPASYIIDHARRNHLRIAAGEK
jgi:hypothetical protein